VGVGAERRILGALAEADADAHVGLGVDVPAHRGDVAGVDATHAAALDRARVAGLAGVVVDRRAAGRVPGVAAVVRPRHALLTLGAVLRPDVTLVGRTATVG